MRGVHIGLRSNVVALDCELDLMNGNGNGNGSQKRSAGRTLGQRILLNIGGFLGMRVTVRRGWK